MIRQLKYFNNFFIATAAIISFSCCSRGAVSPSENPPAENPPVVNYGSAQSWLTKSDGTIKLQKQTDLIFNSPSNANNSVEIDAVQLIKPSMVSDIP